MCVCVCVCVVEGSFVDFGSHPVPVLAAVVVAVTVAVAVLSLCRAVDNGYQTYRFFPPRRPTRFGYRFSGA